MTDNNKKYPVVAIVMASGYSRRFGEETDKLRLEYEGKVLYERVLEQIVQVPFFEQIVVYRDEKLLESKYLSKFLWILNKEATLGQSASIVHAARYVKSLSEKECNIEGLMFFTADQPLLESEDIEKLLDDFMKDRSFILRPQVGDRYGSPVIFPLEMLDELMDLRGDEGGRKLIEAHKDRVKNSELNNPYALEDVDTMEDYHRLLGIILSKKKE